MTKDAVKLPEPFESLLTGGDDGEGWPVQQPEGSWDEHADAIVARLEGVEVGSTADDLLEAPLPGDEVPESMRRPIASRDAADEDAAAGSLADLARAALAAKEADEQSALANETLQLARASRPNLNLVPPPRDSSPEAPASQPGPEPSAEAKPPPATQDEKPTPWWPILGGLAVAAGVVVFLLFGQGKGDDGEARLETPSPAASPAKPGVPTQPATPRAIAKQSEGVSPESLPEEKAVRPKAVGAGGKANAAPPASVAAVSPEAPQTPDEKPAEAEDDGEIPGLQMADDSTANLPEKPSSGAIQAAIGMVLGRANACVAGHDEGPSRATLVFNGADGKVKSVTVSGPAAGTPAEGCIKSALSGARVSRFARASYTVGSVTVRP